MSNETLGGGLDRPDYFLGLVIDAALGAVRVDVLEDYAFADLMFVFGDQLEVVLLYLP
jgi:hypothetical protein